MSHAAVSIVALADGAYLLQGTTGGRPLILPLLVGSEAVVLMDTGCASDVEALILPAFAQLEMSHAQLTHIINTHCDVDHQGGNAGMKQAAPAAKLYCGEADREQIETPAAIFTQRYDAYRARHAHFYPDAVRDGIMQELGAPQPVDGVFTGGETIRLGPDRELEILHLPGHSRGHLGVFDRKHGILFGGDAIHGAVYLDTAGKPALCPTYLQVPDYLRTIEKIRAFAPAAYVGCHWPVKRGAEVAEFCDESRDFVLKAEALILAELKNAPNGLTLTELCAQVGPALGTWPAPVNHELCYAFAGHLDDLESRGVITAAAGTPARYTLSSIS